MPAIGLGILQELTVGRCDELVVLTVADLPALQVGGGREEHAQTQPCIPAAFAHQVPALRAARTSLPVCACCRSL